MSDDHDRALTSPYGHPTEAEIRLRIHEGVETRVRQIEEGRQKTLVFDALRLMEPEARARLLKQIIEVFGAEAGIKDKEGSNK